MPDPDSINNNTAAEIPTPDLSSFPVFGDNILLRPYQPKENKIGSIMLPSKVAEDRLLLQNIGEVVKLGELAYHDPNLKPGEPRFPFGYFGRAWVKVGDWALYPRNAGQRLKYKGVEFLLIKDTMLLGAVADPKDIDPNYFTIF